MKKIIKLKLGELNKLSMEPRMMSRLYGGNYCAHDNKNSAANTESGKCSCMCDAQNDYYTGGLKSNASFFKNTTAWGYCG